MSDVQIDGVKYIPITEVENIQVEKIRQVLESQKYLSKSAIAEILKAFEKSEEVKPKKAVSSKINRQFEYNSMHKTLFNISGVLSNGSILYKTRSSPVRWNIHQAIMIRKHMNKDSSKGMSYKDVLDLEKKVKLSQNLTRKIMFNIEHGDLVKFIEEWKVKHNQKPLESFKPVENNPQKRKESVLYG